MRPRIDVDNEVRDQIKAYANRHGLKVSHAWALAVETGLQELEGQENG